MLSTKALMILYLWPHFPKRNIDDRSRTWVEFVQGRHVDRPRFLTMAVNMATELGFPRLPLEIPGDEMQKRCLVSVSGV